MRSLQRIRIAEILLPLNTKPYRNEAVIKCISLETVVIWKIFREIFMK